MPQNKRRKTSLLRRGHYWVGLGLALPLVMLALTGLLLNHSDDLTLAQRYSAQDWLLNVYGVIPVAPEQGFKLADQWISYARGKLLLDDKILGDSDSPPLAAAILNELVVVAYSKHLSLFTPQGQQVERIELPTELVPLRNITTVHEQLLAQSDAAILATNSDFLRWSSYAANWPGGNAAQALPASLQTQIVKRLSANTLTWEKIILDTHSGRIFGAWGPIVLDVVALITLVLAVTGCLLWLKRRR